MVRRGSILRHWASFRRRLAVIAAVGLVVNIAMATLLVGIAQSANEVVAAARASHLRTRSFSALQFAAERYHRATYDVMRWQDPAREAERKAAAVAFREARQRIARLTAERTDQQATKAHILDLTDQLQSMIDQLPVIVAQVDEQWRQNGSTAAMQAIDQRSQPFFKLGDALQHEIEINDVALRDATEQADRLQIAVIPVTMAALALTLLTTVVVFLLIVGRLSPALRKLEAGAHQFASGRTDYRISIDGHDEFARLAGSFNAMADQLGEQQRGLRDAAAGLERAVEARTADLEEANAALAAADQRRRVFFAEVSHELRTPITIIQGEAQVALRQCEPGTSHPAESFERILGQSREVGRLINDLFLIARAEADGLDLHMTVLDAGDLIARVADDFQAIASDCGATIVTCAPGPLLVDGDAGRLRQVLGAALDNAIRHGNEGVTIEIAARRAAGGIEIRIGDDGPGVDPGLLDTLLQRFRRGATTAEGSGLGLTIIRALIEAHGGRVALANRSTGGLDVILWLPAAPRQPRMEREDAGPAAGGGRTKRR